MEYDKFALKTLITFHKFNRVSVILSRTSGCTFLVLSAELEKAKIFKGAAFDPNKFCRKSATEKSAHTH
jgi:hypothetical protein